MKINTFALHSKP